MTTRKRKATTTIEDRWPAKATCPQEITAAGGGAIDAAASGRSTLACG
jgi:hypothetical protein